MEDSLARLQYLYNLWCTQQLTEDESGEYFALLEKHGTDAALEPLMNQSWTTARDEGDLELEKRNNIANNILSGPQRQAPVIQRVSLIGFISQWRWAAAASVALLVTAGIYFSVYHHTRTNGLANKSALPAADKAPGEEGAILTLADGSHVVLDSLADGIVAKQNGTDAVIKNGQLSYLTSAGTPKEELVYNTVSTPRGRQFQLLLPDGTKVWLNAATSIKYPTAFAAHERNVEVTGEAYFEVAQDKSKPFRVHFTSSAEGNRRGTILALGTSFNVSAYRDDAAAKVTLLEGKVLVSPSSIENQNGILIPGQQASMLYNQLQQADMTIQRVDTSKVIAWKNGMLNLHNLALAEVMKQISRWYNIDVVYEGNIPDITFWGEISRTENLSTVLSFMAQSGVNFKIEDGGKKIIVKK